MSDWLRRTLSHNFSLLFHGVTSYLLLYFLSLFSFLRQMFLLQKGTFSCVFLFGPFWVWSMLLCNSAIIAKHYSLKRCPHSCPLMIFPDFLVNRWAFSFWILLFSFSDFSFKSWSFLILWLIAWRSVSFKGSSSESPSGMAACNDIADSWQWRSYWRLPTEWNFFTKSCAFLDHFHWHS